DKHLAAFQAQDSIVNTQLGLVRDSLVALGVDAKGVDPILAEHDAIVKRYLDALRSYDPSTITSTQRTDSVVRGIDRPLTAAMDAMITGVQVSTQSKYDTMLKDATASYRALRTTFVITLLIGVLGQLLIAWATIRPVTTPTAELVTIATRIAEGDLREV